MNLREQHSTLTVTTSHCVFCRSLQHFKSTRSHYRKRAQHQKWQNTAWEGEGQGFDPVPRVGYTFLWISAVSVSHWKLGKEKTIPITSATKCRRDVQAAGQTGCHVPLHWVSLLIHNFINRGGQRRDINSCSFLGMALFATRWVMFIETRRTTGSYKVHHHNHIEISVCLD